LQAECKTALGNWQCLRVLDESTNYLPVAVTKTISPSSHEMNSSHLAPGLQCFLNPYGRDFAQHVIPCHQAIVRCKIHKDNLNLLIHEQKLATDTHLLSSNVPEFLGN